jgi:hypothetical protein
MPGEAGLLMVTLPKGNGPRIDDPKGGWSAMYFNECMNGFEYQVAGHMIWEGLIEEGLAITRAIHDRYHASRRNPWNEVECGDHYARSMASYGVFLAACGYEYHGPKGFLAFRPRIGADDFRAAFTTAEGWGSFAQQRTGQRLSATISVRWGKLELRTLRLGAGEKADPQTVVVEIDGRALDGVTIGRDGAAGAVDIHLPRLLTVRAHHELNVALA